MANMSDIRFHIKSVKQTRQITNAMHMVSAARMRRALDGIAKNRAYFYHALDVIVDIRNHTGDIHHPYIDHRPGNKVAYIVVSGEKGLSGNYNHAVLALADGLMRRKTSWRSTPSAASAARTICAAASRRTAILSASRKSRNSIRCEGS